MVEERTVACLFLKFIYYLFVIYDVILLIRYRLGAALVGKNPLAADPKI